MTAYVIVYGIDPTDRFAAHAFPTREVARLAEKTLVPPVPVDGYGRHAPDREARPGVGGCGYIIEKEEDITFGGFHLVSVYNALTEGTVKKFESRTVGLKRLMCALSKLAVPTMQEISTMDQIENQTGAQVEATTKPPRQYKVGEFKPVRRTSTLGVVVEAVMAGGTLAEVAAMAEMTEGDLIASLKSLRRSHGIDHEVVGGALSLKIPEGQSPFIVPKEPKPKVERSSNGSNRTTIAENGVITLLVDKNPKRPTAAAYARFELYRNGQTVSEFLAAGGTKADLSWDRSHDFIRIEEQARAAE